MADYSSRDRSERSGSSSRGRGESKPRYNKRDGSFSSDDRSRDGRGSGDQGCRDSRGYGRRDDRGYGRRDDRDGERRFERRDDRRDDRGYGRRDDRGYGRRDDRDGERRFERRDERRDDRGYGRRDDRRDDRGYGRRDDRDGERRVFSDRDERGGRKEGGERKQHSQRAGSGRERRVSHPQRSGFREERMNARANDPDLPNDIDIKDLDPSVLQDLRSLAKGNAEQVAKHMIMAATLMDDAPELALAHARAAKDRAGRVGVVRETAGIAAYRAGEWKEALAELRAARRISGGPGLIAVMADCERGLGQPERAIELARSEEASQLDHNSKIELAIVVSGARRDLGQFDAAVVELERFNPSPAKQTFENIRLAYAYADALLSAGRVAEAKDWFNAVTELDLDEDTDAFARIEECDEALKAKQGE